MEHTDWCTADPAHTGQCQGDTRTAAATAARVRRRLERNARELRDVGWGVVDPGTLQAWPGRLREMVTGHRPPVLGPERHEFSDRATDADAGRLVLPWQYDADGKRLTP